MAARRMRHPTGLPRKGPIPPAKPEGWVRWVFWGLRIYIAAMLVLVAIGFSRGLK
jgi:hypothetical protein